jgi:hypothetical protein
LQRALPVQVVHDRGEQVVVEALAVEVLCGQGYAEVVVDRQEILLRLVHEQPPQPAGLLVAALQGHHPRPGPLLEPVVGVELRPRRPVEAGQIADRQLVRGLRLADVEQVLDEHPERGAPVAEMIGPDHPVAEPLQQPHARVTDHGRAQVPDVHLLGHVRRRIVDHQRLRRW